MTVSAVSAPTPPAEPPARKQPRTLHGSAELSDRAFAAGARSIGVFVLIMTGAIGLFLGLKSIPVLHHYGLHFFTGVQWDPETNQIGIAAVLLGTLEVAVVAMLFTVPLSIGAALFISEYAPRRLKSWLILGTDLMAAVPSIVYGFWGFFLLEPHAIGVARWLSQYLGWIPIFHVPGDPGAPVWQQATYTGSTFMAGMAVSMMAIPLATAVMRAVFDQAPVGEREAAMALGGTRWGVVQRVVLPFGRGGMIGGLMLALGRALGETAAVLIILSPFYAIRFRVLVNGGQTTSALIAGNFGQSTAAELSALLTAGFVLFLITLAVNFVAASVIARSRSGAGTDI